MNFYLTLNIREASKYKIWNPLTQVKTQCGKRYKICHVMSRYWIYDLQVPTKQQLLILCNHQSVSNSMSVNLLINRCIKWISKSICAPCLTEDPGWSSTSKHHHPSHVHMLDRYLHPDRASVIYIAQQRDRIKRQTHQKSCQDFSFF